MRIISWNCHGGRQVDDCLAKLTTLRADADLVTLQECSRPDGARTKIIWQHANPNQCVDEVSTQASLQMRPAHQVIWQGIQASRNGGVAVVSTRPALQIEFVKIPFLHRTVVPVHVHAPEPFLFVGVWTHREPSYAKVAWDAMSACAHEANKRGLPLVAAGDFNIWPALEDRTEARTSSKFLTCMQNKLRLVSVYHAYHPEKEGSETRFTHYFRFNKDKGYHLDYCFVPES